MSSQGTSRGMPFELRAEGWEGLSNGKLLAAASAKFDVVITVDRNLVHQQSGSTLPIAVIAIDTVDTKIEALALVADQVLSLLNQKLGKRVYVVTGRRGRR